MQDVVVPIAHEYWPGRPDKLNKIPIQFKRNVDLHLVDKIMEFINSSLSNMSKLTVGRAVVGLSGGLDSTCVLKLCKKALGFDRVTAVIVDLGLDSHREQTAISIKLAENMQVQYQVIKADNLLNEYNKMLNKNGPFTEINIITRCIQNTIFQLADSISAAVVCTSDRSEELLGRHMECFYGHFAPIIGLFKTEVADLARTIGIDDQIIQNEPGCKDAWLDYDVLGATYDYIDPILYLLVEKRWDCKQIAEKFDLDQLWLQRIEHRVKYQGFRTKMRTFCPVLA